MLISPDEARRILVERTEQSLVQASAKTDLSRYAFQTNGHVLIGDVAVRGYKHKQRWRLDSREIERAAGRLADLDIDPGHLITARLEWDTAAAWQSQIGNWMSQATNDEMTAHGCTCDGPDERHVQENAEGLPCGLTWRQFQERQGQRPLAGTRPLPLLTWSGTHWMVPAAYAALLDRSAALAATLTEQAARCTGCGSGVDVWTRRTASAAGFSSLCPACAASTARPYHGHLAGTAYASLSKNSRADTFLCCLCPEPQRALYWDHCHEHGFIRGPVCPRCNNAEGSVGRFAQRAGGVEHLLRCTGCRTRRSLPPAHRPYAVLEFVDFAPHAPCGTTPRQVWGETEEDGTVRFPLVCYCRGQAERWEQTLPAARVRELLRIVIDRTLGPETA